MGSFTIATSSLRTRESQNLKTRIVGQSVAAATRYANSWLWRKMQLGNAAYLPTCSWEIKVIAGWTSRGNELCQSFCQLANSFPHLKVVRKSLAVSRRHSSSPFSNCNNVAKRKRDQRNKPWNMLLKMFSDQLDSAQKFNVCWKFSSLLNRCQKNLRLQIITKAKRYSIMQLHIEEGIRVRRASSFSVRLDLMTGINALTNFPSHDDCHRQPHARSIHMETISFQLSRTWTWR